MKRFIKISSFAIAASMILACNPTCIFADEAADAYYKEATVLVENASKELEKAQASVIEAKNALDVALKGDDSLLKEQASLKLTVAENQARWCTDQLSNAQANLASAQSRVDMDKKNKEEIVAAQAAMVKEMAVAANSLSTLAQTSPSLKAQGEELSKKVADAQAQALALLSMKYEYEDPYGQYENFVFSKEHVLGLLDTSKLNEKDLQNYSTWLSAKKGASISPETKKEINEWIGELEDIYYDWRAGKSNGEYYDAICKSVDDSYEKIFVEWANKKTAKTTIEKNVYKMFDDVMNSKVATLNKFFAGENLSSNERKMVALIGKYQDDLEFSWHDMSDSALESFVKYMEDFGIDDKVGLDDPYETGDVLPY